MRTAALAALVLGLPAPLLGLSVGGAEARDDLPIRQIVLQKPGGPATPIYGFPVRIGSTVVETGLDTGSIGLRVLPGTLRPGDAAATAAPETWRIVLDIVSRTILQALVPHRLFPKAGGHLSGRCSIPTGAACGAPAWSGRHASASAVARARGFCT